jgi:peroxiredoxin
VAREAPTLTRSALYRYAVGLIAIAAAALLIAVFAPFFVSKAPGRAGPGGLAGQTAPVFALRDDRGAPVSLPQYRGKIVVMNLWASWCPPCREEMPDLQRLSETYSARGLAIVGVNEGESPERARAFAAALHIRFPIWVDTAERYGRTYAALGLPTTVIVDRNGTVVRGFDGALTFEQMKAAVEPLIARS